MRLRPNAPAARLALLSALIGAAVSTAGCNPSRPSAAAPSSSAPTSAPPAEALTPSGQRPMYLSHAQTNLSTAKLWVGPLQVNAELCRSVPEVATGLMHRTGIGPEDTMLFVFGTGERRSFYMRNVSFPISAAYIDSEGIIREIIALKAMDETPVWSSSDNIQYVLEAAPDFFLRHNLGPGVLVATDRGALRETLARTAQVR